ncbi:MAG: hypothetical protein ACT4QC_08140 [Planctomycetaceae bacterium]
MNRSFLDRSTLKLATRLIAALGLLVACGCDNTASEVADLARSQASAQESLQAQGVTISKKKLPAFGSATVLDFTTAKDISDNSFRLLKEMGLMGIMEIDFSGTKITDAQIAKLNEPGVAEWIAILNLSDTEITDAGLKEVARLPILADLNISKTKITPDGVTAFHKARDENPAIQSKKPRVKQ